MKYRILSVCLCAVLMLSGCNLQQEKIYQGNMNLSENGIVSQDVFRQIKDDNAVVTFSGMSDGCKYEWTVFGDDISSPEELNLAVEISEKTEQAKITFRSDSDFGFSPVLSIYLDSVWDCQSATVYDSENNAVCGASVTGSDNTILNFTALETKGDFYIRPDNPDDSGSIVVTAEVKETTAKNSAVTTAKSKSNGQDDYLTPAEQISGNAVSGRNDADNSGSGNSSAEATPDDNGRILSDGSQTEQDKYLTDPVPEGKPMPVEPEDTEINEKNQYTCTFSVECSTILNNLSELNPEKLSVLPADGIIFPATEVTFYEGESVYDVLQRICQENNIHMEASWTPMYNSAYVEGINNLYEFDCGSLSGWMYRVDGWYPNYGCSRYQLKDGEVVEWRYTCDLGYDVGGGYAVNGGEP
ncbi:MAG: DUF4430 domain-containing protein [Ruminococcus flavefaciens]|nr:DUF4430 domain-containing protein [Ruminococcus flavefaciens]